MNQFVGDIDIGKVQNSEKNEEKIHKNTVNSCLFEGPALRNSLVILLIECGYSDFFGLNKRSSEAETKTNVTKTCPKV